MKKLFTIVITILTFSVHCQGQTYDFARLDNTFGLSNNQVECIFKDSRGFIWFGTNFGLNRYDGYNFKVYKYIRNDSTSLLYNSIRSIEEDIDGNLWIRGNSSYVIYDYTTEKFNWNLNPVLSKMGLKPNPELIEIDHDKNFYLYYPDDGVYKYDVAGKKISHYKQSDATETLSTGTISSIKSGNSCFWALFRSGLLERYNEKTGQVDFSDAYLVNNTQGSSIVKDLFLDSDGCPWVYPGVEEKGVLYFDLFKSKWILYGKNKSDMSISSDFVRDIAQDREGKIWIATDHGGINIFDKKKGSIELLKHDPLNPNSISQNSVISLYCDKDGIVWAGTYKNGVSYYHPGIFKFNKSPLFFYHQANLDSKDCNSFCEDKKGNLWIGTNGEGLVKYEKSTGSFKVYKDDPNNPHSISSNIIISILEDHEGTMWFGTFLGGLNRLDGERFIHYLPESDNVHSISNKSVYSLLEDKEDNIWVATLGGGVNKLDKKRNHFQVFNTANTSRISSDYILSMSSKDGVRIFLSTSVGMDVLDTRTQTIEAYFQDEKQLNLLSDRIIYNSIVDVRGQLWMATDNGINIYSPDKNKFTYLDQKSGLPSDQVVSILEDKNGKIWAGTRNGLACITYVKNDQQEESYSIVSFDEEDGLLSPICNQNAIYENKDGNIYVGTTKGYTFFDPSTIHFNTLVPQPRFTSFLIGNETINPGIEYKGRTILSQSIAIASEIALPYSEKNFTLNFSSLSYMHPQKNRYKYKLEGFDERFIESKAGTASYSNLNPGTYTFIVYASNNDDVWSTDPLTLKIVIQPPFWLTWWAISVYVLLLVLLLWMIIYFNLNKQKKKYQDAQRMLEIKQLHEMDEMKLRFFTNVSHEFRTPLTLILNPVDKLIREAGSEEQRNLLSIIHKNAVSLLDLVNQLLDFRKLDVGKVTLNKSVGDIIPFVKDICYSFTDWANKKSVNLTFSTVVSEFQMEFDHEKLKKIITNLLSNAFKFTPDNGKIDVNISLPQESGPKDKMIKITVSDTGIGMDEEHLGKIFERFYRIENPDANNHSGTGVGLHLVSEYVKLHNGEIKVESTPGKGSSFSVYIPVVVHLHKEIIAQAPEPLVEPEKIDSSLENSSPLPAKKSQPVLLVVDDNEDFRNYIATLFEKSFNIVTANDGEAAYAIILSTIPDLIISDVMMPKMDGFELCRLVKKDIRTSHIPIILLTAKASKENEYSGIEAGADDYISKPFNMDMLILKVSRLIERQKKMQERFHNKINVTPSEVAITSMDEKFVKKAVSLVETNMSNPDFLVEDLCREMGMSRVYFYKKILSLTAKTPSEFIRFIRLKRAADLLEKSQLFVNEIAFQVGFNDPKYFRKYFKEEFGVTPNEYKGKFNS